MPEASIDQHGYALSSERDVNAKASIRDRLIVDAKSIAGPMKPRPH